MWLVLYILSIVGTVVGLHCDFKNEGWIAIEKTTVFLKIMAVAIYVSLAIVEMVKIIK